MIGQTLSHYRIVRALGAGGMGEVFLADDLKLGRQVALKVLARESASDPDRRARFEREARAVAALNHPSIVTIHSVEEDQGVIFITMELVEGRTLADNIPSGGMALADLLRIAIPLTDAVGTAHRRGITHRDLKPANVMVADDGRVKVLDFGLAKQDSQEALQSETVLQPTAHVTAEGKILGTVAYMSPEQAQGKPVDQRSDIFSLGIVLFEMATGRRPFTGDSNVSVLSSVLKDTPPSVTALRPELPRELARIVKHCLAKDPEDRYQNAKDLRNDLRALKEESDSGELTPGSQQGVMPVSAASGVTSPPTPVPSAVTSPPRRRAAWAGAGAVVLVAAASIVAWSWSAPRPPRIVSMKQITTDGIQKVSLLTDGARLYFRVSHLGSGAHGRSALAQVAVGGGETVELAPESPSLFDIDPAGQQLLVGDFPGTGDGVLAVMPVLGGAERPVGDLQVSGGATWTPDKSHIVYSKGTELRLASSDGSGSRTLLTAPGTPFAPRLSPDGERLRYSVRDPKTGDNSLWEASADGRDPHPLLPGWTGAQNPCCGGWTTDGRYFVFEASGNLWARAEARSLFRRTTDAPTQLTFGPLLFSRVIPGRDGKHLFAIGDQRRGRLARYDPTSHQFTEFLGGLSAEGVAISPDGASMVYTTYPEGTLWRSRVDGSERRQLTFPPMSVFLPRWSPDGSQIAFFGGTSNETLRIYLVPAAGGVPRRGTTGTVAEADPSWSPDGRQIIFGSTSGPSDERGPNQTPFIIQRLDLATGRLTPIPGSQGLFSPRWSPDGRWIVALSRDSGRLVIFDVASEQWSNLLPPGPSYGWPSWSADSKVVTFVRGIGRENAILRVRLADRKVEMVFDGKGTDLVFGNLGPWFGSTPDGWPLELLDAGTHDIYALDWDAP
jgi:eukaryotic-like serine/threonine-protein kinase